MKNRNEPVVVRCNALQEPETFIWRNRLYRVTAVDDSWERCGKWWLDGTIFKRTYRRVTARPPGPGPIVHAVLYQQGGAWTLESECD